MNAAAQLREAGLRATKQRIQVLEIVHSKRHVTVDQVVSECAGQGASIDLSTAYRTLETLNDAGLITHAHLGNKSPTYHRVDEFPHVHLVCRDCDRVGSIPAADLAAVVGTVDSLRGFVVDVSHLVMHGRCAECEARVVGVANATTMHGKRRARADVAQA